MVFTKMRELKLDKDSAWQSQNS